jgi:hypothetical protein
MCVCPPDVDVHEIYISCPYSCAMKDVHAIANSITFYPMLDRRLTDMDVLQEGGREGEVRDPGSPSHSKLRSC